MMEAEKEIEVVQYMLDLLYKCLFISIRNKQYKEIRSTIIDIKIVKTELKRIKEKQALGDSIREK